MNSIRMANAADINRMAQIEALCFPVAEAASLESFTQRFAVFSDCFYVLEVDGKVVGHINGCIYDTPTLPDVLYSNAQLHQPDGSYQTVFGLAVDPAFQKRGYASELLQHFAQVSRDKGLKGMVLTCKAHLVSLYEKHNYVQQGVSASSHGGAQWLDMVHRF
jgi:ribosomal protein S18 acetylase RimI-like enzyme